MKKIIKNKEKMKNTMYIVFGVFALALFTITRANPSYASDGLILDKALDAIAQGTTSYESLTEDNDPETIQENEEQTEMVIGERNEGGEENNQNLDETTSDKENIKPGEDINETNNDQEEINENNEEPEYGNTNNDDIIDENNKEINEEAKNNEDEENKWEGMYGDFKIDKEENTREIMGSVKTATLLPGEDFNKKIKTLAKGTSVTDNYEENTSITSIQKGTATDSVKTDYNRISIASSEYPVYAWFDGGEGVLYYDTEATKIYFNENCKHMFNNLKGLQDFNFKIFDLSRVTSMESMFYAAGLKKIDFSNMDLHSVTNVEYMFQSNEIIEEADFSSVNLSGLESISRGLFYNLPSLKDVNFSGANLSSVKEIGRMFGGCSNLEKVNFSNMNLSSLTNIDYLISSSNRLQEINLSNTNLSSLNEIIYMFHGAHSLRKIDFSNTNLENLEKFNSYQTFPDIIQYVNFEGTNLNSLTSMMYLFQSKNNLKEVNFSGTKLNSLENMYGMFQSNNGLTGIDFSHTDLSHVKNMEIMFNSASRLEIVKFGENTLSNVTTMRDMFTSCYSLKEIDASNWNVSSVNDMNDMFYSCYNLKKLDVSNWDTSNVERMSDIFNGCRTLEILDVSNWNTSKLTSMGGIFNGCSSLVELDLSSWDTSGVTYMGNMFKDTTNLKTIYVSDKFTTGNVTSSSNMFKGITSIVGGNGTTYDVNHIDAEYARIDTSEISGYFTNILDKQYTISYNLDGGSIAGEKTIYTQRDSFILPTPIRTGYTFLGWTGSNGDEPQTTVNIVKYTKGNLEYTANWKINKYKIILDTDGGNEINSIEREYSGSLLNITLPTPVKECNDFSGWNVELPELMPAHDITLKAIWNYTCSRASGGGGSKKSEPTTSEVNNDTTQEHNSADDNTTKPTSDTTTAPINEETTKEVISVTQETTEDGTEVEVVVEAVAIKNTNIVATVRTETPVNGTTSSTYSSSTHTQEQTDAYSFAKANGITTTESIETAKMNTELIRIQMAKMLSNFAINVLGEEPDVSKGTADFDDVTNKMDEQYDNAVTKAYQLGIMGQNVKDNEFRPNDEVSRAEFTASLSRLLYKTDEGEYKGTSKYYVPHIAKLYNEGIVNKADPNIKEKRGYVMTMLKRTVE